MAYWKREQPILQNSVGLISAEMQSRVVGDLEFHARGLRGHGGYKTGNGHQTQRFGNRNTPVFDLNTLTGTAALLATLLSLKRLGVPDLQAGAQNIYLPIGRLIQRERRLEIKKHSL